MPSPLRRPYLSALILIIACPAAGEESNAEERESELTMVSSDSVPEPQDLPCPTGSPEPQIPAGTVAKAKLELSRSEGRWYHDGAPFSGHASVIHPDGSRRELVGYWNGKKHGLARSWHANGQLRRRARYCANHLHGAVRSWSEAGILVAESSYVDGQRHGLERRWYPDGSPAKRRHLAMGDEDGLQQAWLPNGKLYVNYEARKGRIFGLKRATLCYSLEDEDVQY